MSGDGFERVTYRVVWRAEIGWLDGEGRAWDGTSVSEPFPTEDAAWEFLKRHPNVIPQLDRRRYRHKDPFGAVRVRRVEEPE